MMRTMTGARCKRVLALVIGGGLLAVGPVGCATKTQTGALVGGAGGAAVGAAIGSASGNAGKGALIGGAVGLIGGGLIGHGMDKADEAKEKEARRRYEEEERYSRRSSRSYADAGGSRVTTEDVVAWTQQGKSDDVIIDRIDRSGSTFRLTETDEDALRDKGVSEGVIRAMNHSGRR
jgi:hypothetical protein